MCLLVSLIYQLLSFFLITINLYLFGSNSFRRHVQVNNESAIEFYKKFDFEIVEKKEAYYKRIEPSDAFVLKKSLANN